MTVRQIQHLLAYLGYYTASVDGIWGNQSSAATYRFQQDYGGMTVDGIAGSETQEALKQAVANGMPEKQEKDTFWKQIRYWNREEFRCRCGGKYCCGFPAEPSEVLVQLVDDIRHKAGRPGHRSSGLRCEIHNSNEGGVWKLYQEVTGSGWDAFSFNFTSDVAKSVTFRLKAYDGRKK